MPELPEVEVVKKSLENKLKNLTIKSVFINNNKLRYKINNRQFDKIKGKKITTGNIKRPVILMHLSISLLIDVIFLKLFEKNGII